MYIYIYMTRPFWKEGSRQLNDTKVYEPYFVKQLPPLSMPEKLNRQPQNRSQRDFSATVSPNGNVTRKPSTLNPKP